MNRRGFLKGMGGILLAGAAPAIVRADSLMRVVPREAVIVDYFDGQTIQLTGAEILARQADGLVMLREWWARERDGLMVRHLETLRGEQVLVEPWLGSNPPYMEV